MAFIQLTRPDNSPIYVNPETVSRFASAEGSDIAGASTVLIFSGSDKQGVKESLSAVATALSA